MKTQGTVVRKSRFQIDMLEDRIAPQASATVNWTGTADVSNCVAPTTSIVGTGTTSVGLGTAHSDGTLTVTSTC